MRNLIIIIATLAVAMAGTSCLRNDQAEKERAMQDSLNRVLGDSLATALAEKDSLMVLMNDINDGLNEIKNIENIVAQGNIGAETPDRRAKLREDIILIRQSIENGANASPNWRQNSPTAATTAPRCKRPSRT